MWPLVDFTLVNGATRLVPRSHIALEPSDPEPIRRLLGYQSHGRLIGAYQGDPDGHWRVE
jgi:hypothetical protein